MPAPILSPTRKPWQRALDFHRSRVPITPAEFKQLTNEAQLRAFTVSGLARQASVIEAYHLAEKALETGMTTQQFRAELTAFLEANEGAALAPARIDLIFRQAIGTARAIGRYEQMSDPDVLAARPYWMYPLGPDDDRTTEICRELQGFVAPADAEVWQHIYPPNHFNERHWQVVSLTETQAKATGKIYKGPSTDAYPVNEDTGGRLLPDPGFDFRPSLVASDGEQLLREIADLSDPIAAKTPADYGLPALTDLPESALADAPALLERLPVDRSADDIAAAWERFQEAVGIAPDEDSTILVDSDGDGVFVNRRSFDHIIGEDAADPNRKIDGASRAQFFGFFRPTIESPTEIWWSPRRNSAGETVFTKVYVALYRDAAKNRSFQVFLVRSPQGWLMWSGYPRDAAGVEALRRGFLGYRSYSATRSAA